MANLTALFNAVAESLDGDLDIERAGRLALLEAADRANSYEDPSEIVELPESVKTILQASDAHPCCDQIAQTPLPWAPPVTSDNPAYVEHSKPKVHVELLGPNGYVKHDTIRLGLYGMLPNFEYGIRTHPAEEVFVMLAGKADWIRGDSVYETLYPGERSYHPSLMPHANRTTDSTFMSVYVWSGDVATDNYVYEGIPK